VGGGGGLGHVLASNKKENVPADCAGQEESEDDALLKSRDRRNTNTGRLQGEESWPGL